VMACGAFSSAACEDDAQSAVHETLLRVYPLALRNTCSRDARPAPATAV
jgi:hypothetical protein